MSFKPARTAAILSALTLSALTIAAPSATAAAHPDPAAVAKASSTFTEDSTDTTAPGGATPAANVWTW